MSRKMPENCTILLLSPFFYNVCWNSKDTRTKKLFLQKHSSINVWQKKKRISTKKDIFFTRRLLLCWTEHVLLRVIWFHGFNAPLLWTKDVNWSYLHKTPYARSVYVHVSKRFLLYQARAHLKVWIWRSSRQEVFCKKGVLENFAKFTGKHLCQGLFFNKVAGLRPATLFKKRLWHRCFPVNFAKILGTPFFIEHLQWLLLNMETSL